MHRVSRLLIETGRALARRLGQRRVVIWTAAAIGAWMLGCFKPVTVPPTASIPNTNWNTPASSGTVPALPSLPQPTLPVVVQNPWVPDVPTRDWKYIVVHHTATTRGSVESIHASHLQRKDSSGNSWLGIGYHFVIGNGDGMGDGEIEPTFRWREQLQGAHAGISEYNQTGIGVVLVGNFEEQPPSSAQLASVKRLVGILKTEYGIQSDNVKGHGDIKATACPGHLFPIEEVGRSVAVDWDPAGLHRGMAEGRSLDEPAVGLASFKGTLER